jgi:hypothetical protein
VHRFEAGIVEGQHVVERAPASVAAHAGQEG